MEDITVTTSSAGATFIKRKSCFLFKHISLSSFWLFTLAAWLRVRASMLQVIQMRPEMSLKAKSRAEVITWMAQRSIHKSWTLNIPLTDFSGQLSGVKGHFCLFLLAANSIGSILRGRHGSPSHRICVNMCECVCNTYNKKEVKELHWKNYSINVQQRKYQRKNT